ncbi:MAG: hypothetical protein LBL46_02970 [Rickettsiales bacterium]|jgi:hypothetical protein|nr:hypothetical protein [Rickettsiales bacterium]
MKKHILTLLAFAAAPSLAAADTVIATKGYVDGGLATKADSSAIPTKVSDLANDSQFVSETEMDATLTGYATGQELADGLATKQNTLPAGATAGQVLKSDGAGGFTWAADNDNTTDITGKADKAIPAAAGNVATLGADGNLVDGGTLGTAAFADADDFDANGDAAAVQTILDNFINRTDGFATTAQGTLAGTALQPGANISELNNDALYLTSGDISGKQDKIGGGTDGSVITNSGVAGSVNELAVDATSGGTASSTSLITSGAVAAGLATKQATLPVAASDATARVLSSDGAGGFVWATITGDSYTGQ